ncbi:MAG TPA: hypothetical protein VKV26_08865 [Dehalococcoidia bacterium]|nr:hypothetical protein [Dehalococcoidia bacterium]
MNATSPRTHSTARDPHTVELGYRSPSEYGALSSDGETVYSVSLVRGGWTCTCKGYAARRTCCHSLAAALPRCYHCGGTSGVRTYTNGWDGGAAITLCAGCAGGR